MDFPGKAKWLSGESSHRRDESRNQLKKRQKSLAFGVG
jgi:hypothetical protein